MSPNLIAEDELAKITEKILRMPKYARMHLLNETVSDLVRQESAHYRNARDLERAIRQKVHNIVAPYLGNTNYELSEQALITGFAQGEEAVKDACLKIMESHKSTAERLNSLEQFYEAIFDRIGNPESILDLACGYHPFGIPWMNLRKGCVYYAFDMIKPRIELINTFFELAGMEPRALQQDILVNPPAQKADVAFFFKEAHRFEQRKRGCNRNFWLSLNVDHLIGPLPITGMKSKYDMTGQHRQLVKENISGFNWKVSEFQIGNELLFWIQK